MGSSDSEEIGDAAMDSSDSEEVGDAAMDSSDSEEAADVAMKAKPHLNAAEKDELVTSQLVERYQERHGKQLFIRFPSRLPDDEKEFQKRVMELVPLVIKAHKPRQRHARFCLVDFKSEEDRNSSLKAFKKAMHTDEKLKKFVMRIPRTEEPGYVDLLIKKKLSSIENKRQKSKLRRAARAAEKTKDFTTSIVITNMPTTASAVEIRQLFPEAFDIQMKAKNFGDTNIVVLNFPSSSDATAAVKKNLSFGGVQLIIKLNNLKQNEKAKGKGKPGKTKQKSNQKKSLPEKLQQSKQKQKSNQKKSLPEKLQQSKGEKGISKKTSKSK